ncbi:MAG: glucosamine-6-phosphate deaminase [Cyanobacteria bacterium K_Offshore_surface_m2_239]|nr:glucosamine-6-phosphate deaminase [Cyanobacteria bacterium K_Offshore_surface_m2_239]
MRTSSVTTTEERCCAAGEQPGSPDSGIQLQVLPTAEAVAEQAALALLDACLARPRRPLGLATGRTMVPIYAAFTAMVQGGSPRTLETLRNHWRSFNLDEYVGLGPEDPGSFAADMRASLGQPLGLSTAQLLLPDGRAADPDAEAQRYGAALREAGGVGLQVLGLGLNGHVGFNEPPCAADRRCRCVSLRASTRQANAAAFGGDPSRVPERAITLGLAEILEAERILLVVTGAAKAPVLRRLLQSSPSADLPASWLHRHPRVRLLADAAAMAA